MTWTFEFTKQAQKQFNAFDRQTQLRIKKAIVEKLAVNPKEHLIPLVGDKVGFYKFRVGDHRLLCHKNNDVFHILIMKAKHRKDVYKR